MELEAKATAIGRSQAVIEFKLDGTIITANNNFLSVMGYGADEIVGRHHSMFVEPAYAGSAEYRAFWERLNRGEFVADKFCRIGKGGKEVWIQASYNPLVDRHGKPFKVVKFATDVTQADEQRLELEAKAAAIARSQAVIEFKLDGTIITANNNFLSVMGYTAEEIVGRHHSMFVEPAYAGSAEYRTFWERLNRGEFVADKFCRIGKGGREVWIQASYNPLVDRRGKPFKVVKFATDVTQVEHDRRRMEEERAAKAEDQARVVKAVTHSMSQLAEGDLTYRLNETFPPEYEKLRFDFNAAMNELSTTAQVANEIADGNLMVDAKPRSAKDVLGIAFAKMIQSLSATANVAEAVADGDLSISVKRMSEKDRLGIVFERMVKNLNATATVADAIAQGDLTVTAKRRSDKDTLGIALETMVLRLREVVADATTAAENVTLSSQEMSSSAGQLSEGSTEQASATEEASASMEEMAANIKQNAENAGQTEKIARQSAKDAEVSGIAVNKAVEAMNTIAEKIAIVQEIARQTDLLALNAAVEAARAGEHGRGFAVVASEVRKLAERSQAAATEISAVAANTVRAAQEAGGMLSKLVPDIKRTAELVGEITAACREQDVGSSQINQALQQLDQVTQQNASVSEELSATSEELAAQAEQLQTTIAFFHVEDSPSGRRASEASSRKSAGADRAVAKLRTTAAAMAKPTNKAAAKQVGAAKGAHPPRRGFVLDLEGGEDELDKEFARK
jgi:methyl-accepting chemotaxis protein